MARGELKRIALDRIDLLMKFARRHAAERPDIARRAVMIAMRIAQKARVRIPKRYRRMFCRKCGTPFWTPNSFRVRVRDRRSTHIVIRCMKCGYLKRIPAARKVKAGRASDKE